MQRIFIVEDDSKLAELLHDTVLKYGFESYIATDFQQIMEEFKNYDPHLVLLDINLPSFDGYYWCRMIRQVSTCPIIFISARIGEMDQVMALENGGDDFITKPFHSQVVLAKIRSQLRRAYGEYAVISEERKVETNGLILYPERFELHFADKNITLTKNEANIIEMLIERYPKVTGREDLLERIWDDQAFVDDNTLNVNLTRVRKKLQELGIENAVETVRGVGYRLHITW
ncbi:MAG TPA: response regulator transcription factor [Pseudogracilibacillus sp.]|nr:response regulator transcription factor [Pseudogracilibacillus sp.]